jgi:hypothetical protein
MFRAAAARRSGPDKEGLVILSSMHKKARLAALSLGGLFSVGLVGALPTPESSVQAQAPSNVAASIERWQALRDNPNAPFESYANFILSHRGWPGEMDLRGGPSATSCRQQRHRRRHSLLRCAAAADGAGPRGPRAGAGGSGQRDKQLRRPPGLDRRHAGAVEQRMLSVFGAIAARQS